MVICYLDVLKGGGERQPLPGERMKMLVIMTAVMMMKMTVTMMMVQEEECARSHNPVHFHAAVLKLNSKMKNLCTKFIDNLNHKI